MLKYMPFLFVFLTLIPVPDSFAQQTAAEATLVNINNISMWIREDGWSGRNPETGRAGIIFPRGTAPVVFQDGLIWVGLVRDGQVPTLRAGGQHYNAGTVPGRIISKGQAEDPRAPDVRIWRIRQDYQTANLTRDAAEIFNTSVDSVTGEQIAAVRAQYETDWNEWPWQKGAPFYDNNENGIMDAGDEPGLAQADQVVWFVANDLDSEAVQGFFGAPPIGLEMQVTLWGYKQPTVLQNMIFKRYRLIYKGTAATPDTARIDSMYIGQWSDTDLGRLSDDLVGCDTLLNLGYTYNSSVPDSQFIAFDRIPPAVGYVLLQGPVTPGSSGDVAIVDFNKIHGFKNLSMSSFGFLTPETVFFEPPCPGFFGCTLWFWNFLRGFVPTSNPNNPKRFTTVDGEPTNFPLAGDPFSATGDIDGIVLPPGDRRIVMSTGPFTMAIGDTQEVVIALIGGLGADNLFSVQVMKHHAKRARQLYRDNFKLPPEPEPNVPPLPKHFRLSQNFPNPFNPTTEIRFELPVARHITLTVYNTLGQKVKTLVEGSRAVGSYSVTWDGTDERGQPVPSGVYFYRFDAGVVSGTKKMILMR